MKRDTAQATYIRGCLKDLDGRYDAAALKMIFQIGVFAADDPSPFAELVDELANDEKFNARAHALDEKLCAVLPNEDGNIRLDLESLEYERRCETRDAAYLLGIAVGRRLGAPPTAGLSRAIKARKAR